MKRFAACGRGQHLNASRAEYNAIFLLSRQNEDGAHLPGGTQILDRVPACGEPGSRHPLLAHRLSGGRKKEDCRDHVRHGLLYPGTRPAAHRRAAGLKVGYSGDFCLNQTEGSVPSSVQDIDLIRDGVEKDEEVIMPQQVHLLNRLNLIDGREAE